MAKAGDALLALNRALQTYRADVKVHSATSKTVVYHAKSKDRVQLSHDVNAALKREGVKFTPNVEDLKVSTFPITTIEVEQDKVKVLYKVAFKPLKGGGSGAGADVTKLGESAQALYAAIANNLGRDITSSDLTLENFTKANKIAFYDGDFEKIKNELPDEWIHSCVMGANELRSRYSSKTFEFHRGSKKVDQIENAFKKINRVEKAFGDLNKWSPADIYIIKKNFDPKILDEEHSLKGLNEKMYELLNDKKVIGVSLKKIEGNRGSISEKNFPNDPKMSKASFKGTSATFVSMDGYVHWGNAPTERIQFRSFGDGEGLTGWQGEIKGASANQGKISLGPLNFLLKSYGVGELPTSMQSAALARQNTESHAEVITDLMINYGIAKKEEKEAVVRTVMGKSTKYRYSKWLVLQLLIKMRDMNLKIANQLTQDMYLYASSQSSFSAPYLKLE